MNIRLPFLTTLILTVATASCTRNEPPVIHGNDTSIVIESNTDKGINPIVTKAGEEDSFWLTVSGPEGFTPIARQLGTERTISDITPGDYTVALVNQQTYTLPAYDLPIYRGELTKTVSNGAATPFAITCTQINTGVRVVFDASITDNYAAPIATFTTTSSASLTLSPADQGNKIAYFEAPSTLTLTFNDGSTPINIGGEPSQSLNLLPKQLWTITLKTALEASGGIEMEVTIDVTVDEQNSELGVGEVSGDGSAVNPYSIASAVNAMPLDGVWIEGYITGSTTLTSTRSGQADNILIGVATNCLPGECIVVELPEGSIRSALNVVDNPGNIGIKVAVKGNVGRAANFTSPALASMTGVSEHAIK